MRREPLIPCSPRIPRFRSRRAPLNADNDKARFRHHLPAPALQRIAMLSHPFARFVAIGFGIVLGWGGPGSAWDIFHGDDSCPTKTVKLPPQKIVLQSSSPDVGVHQRLQGAGRPLYGVPLTGTIYMPLNTP